MAQLYDEQFHFPAQPVDRSGYVRGTQKKKSGMYSFAGPPMLLCYKCLMRLLMCSNVFTLLCCVLLHPVSNLAAVTEQCAYTFKRGRGYSLQWEHRQLVSDLVPGD